MLRVIIINLALISTLLSFAVNAGELIEGNFESGGHQFSFEGISNFKYPFLKLNPEPALIVTHASSYWDPMHYTWPAIKILVSSFRKNKLSLKYMAAIEERSQANAADLKAANTYFPPGINSDDLYPFQGDSHRMIATGHHVVIAGGNFTICACGTVRSIIALSEAKGPLNIHYAMDGIYEGEKGKVYTLLEISKRYDDANFLKYLDESYFNEDSLPCKEASLFALDRKFSYEIYRGKKRIGHRGKSKDLVILRFETSSEILKELNL